MINTQEIKPRNLGVNEAGTYIGIARSTLYDLLKNDPAFPQGFKLGKKRLFPVHMLDAWMQELETGKAVH